MASKQFDEMYKRFEEEFDLTTINNANDRSNLNQFITNLLLIDNWQEEIKQLTEAGASDNIIIIKKLSDAARDLAATNVTLERQLGIDRKSRKKDNSVSTAEYITYLQDNAKAFLDQRLVKVMCPECNVMVFRFSPVHEHTAFRIGVECSQCGKIVTTARETRDVFYDLAKNDKDWRKPYPVRIKQAKKKKEFMLDDTVEPDIIIDDSGDADD